MINDLVNQSVKIKVLKMLKEIICYKSGREMGSYSHGDIKDFD